MNRLRSYRNIEGINQQELGDLLGISSQMVSAIEGGRRAFAGDLTRLGYAGERLTVPDMSAPLHRTRASTPVAAKKRAQELLRLAGEIFAELRDRTERAPRLRLERCERPGSLEALEDLAVEVRYMLDHEENGPIQNLTAAVERAGVCLIPIRSPAVGDSADRARIDGLSAWVDGVPVIGLCPDVPGDRFRFNLAHELAHLLCHAKRTDTIEPEANRFAGALLFPKSEVDVAMPAHPQLRDFIALKSAWGISVAALVYRANDLDYIDDVRFRALQIQMSKWHKSEPARFDPVYGQLLPQLIERNGGTDAVASDLGVSRRHVADLLAWSPRPRLSLA